MGNLLTWVLLIAGVFFKNWHLAGASILLALSCSLMIVLCVMDTNKRKDKLNRWAMTSIILMIIGVFAKTQHLFGGVLFVSLSYIYVLILSVAFLFQTEEKPISKQNIIAILYVFILVIGLTQSSLIHNIPNSKVPNTSQI